MSENDKCSNSGAAGYSPCFRGEWSGHTRIRCLELQVVNLARQLATAVEREERA